MLNAIQKRIPANSEIRLKHYIYNLEKRGKFIELCCIPEPSSIKGNEEAEEYAKLASQKKRELISYPYTDEFYRIDECTYKAWNES